LRARYRWAGLAGLSMGAAIATSLAADVHDLPSLVLIAPYLSMPRRIRWLSASQGLWSARVGPIRVESPRSIHDPAERAANLAYGAVTGRAVHELALLVEKARAALPRVKAPTLLIQSEEDNRVPQRVARNAMRMLGASCKRLVFTHGAGHIITVDYGREHVFEEVCAWLEGGPGTSPQPGHPG
jgi:esterase/lipase